MIFLLAEMKKKSRSKISEVKSNLPPKVVPEADAGVTNGNGNVNGGDDHVEPTEAMAAAAPEMTVPPTGNGTNGDVQDYFNSDIICHHNELCIQEAKRKLVGWDIWKKFKSYFPQARAFLKSSTPCDSCIENDDKVKKAIEDKKELANSQKIALSDIFNERCRPSWARPNTDRVYLVPRA